jgi:CubicO group peptidase (beta-lactamase class C family)
MPSDLADTLSAYLKPLWGEWQTCLAVSVTEPGTSHSFLSFNTNASSNMTVETLFPIASNSKAFTSLAVACLVDSGKLKWSTPVKEILKDFAMQDAVVASQLTVADTLCHRSGLPERASSTCDCTV